MLNHKTELEMPQRSEVCRNKQCRVFLFDAENSDLCPGCGEASEMIVAEIRVTAQRFV